MHLHLSITCFFLFTSLIGLETHGGDTTEREELAKEQRKKKKKTMAAAIVGGGLTVVSIAGWILFNKRKKEEQEKIKRLALEEERQRLEEERKEKGKKRLEEEKIKRLAQEAEKKRKEKLEEEKRLALEEERQRLEEERKEREKKRLEEEKKRKEEERKKKKQRALMRAYTTPTYPVLTSKNNLPKERQSKEVLAFEQLLNDFYTTESLKPWTTLLHDIWASYIPGNDQMIKKFSDFGDRSIYRFRRPRDSEKTQYVIKHGIGRMVCHYNLRRVIERVLDAYQNNEAYKIYTRQQLDCQKPVRKWLLLTSEDETYNKDERIRSEEGLETIFSVEETKELFLQRAELRIDLFWEATSFFSLKFKKREEDIAQMKKELEKLVAQNSRLSKGLVGKVKKFIKKEKRATKEKALDLLLKVKIALLRKRSDRGVCYRAIVVGKYIKPSQRKKVDLNRENVPIFITISKYARLDTSPIAHNFFMVQEKADHNKLKDRPSLIWFDTELGAGWPS